MDMKEGKSLMPETEFVQCLVGCGLDVGITDRIREVKRSVFCGFHRS